MKLDILAFGAHPDDVELSCGGTLSNHIKQGRKVGIIDLTRGELGTRGSVMERNEESANASQILGVSIRENLEMPDGFLENNKENQLKVIEKIRKYKPSIILMNAPYDRHPDHGKGAQLVKESCFLSGLIKIETEFEGVNQEAWRPKRMFHYIQDMHIEPTFIVDISSSFDKKMEAILSYKTQFYSASFDGPSTYISSESFLNALKANATLLGKRVGVQYGEGFIISGATLGLNNFFDQILPEFV